VATTVKKDINKGKDPFPTAEAPDYNKLLARDKQLRTPIPGLSVNPNKLGVKRPYRNTKGQPYTAADMNKSLSNKISKFIANKVEKGLWNQQTACTDDKCGWKQPYDKNDSEKALLHSAINNCPKCKKPVVTKPFSPDF
jgi:hypothetical protein